MSSKRQFQKVISKITFIEYVHYPKCVDVRDVTLYAFLEMTI